MNHLREHVSPFSYGCLRPIPFSNSFQPST